MVFWFFSVGWLVRFCVAPHGVQRGFQPLRENQPRGIMMSWKFCVATRVFPGLWVCAGEVKDLWLALEHASL